MKYEERDGLRILTAEFGYLIHIIQSETNAEKVYLEKFATLDNFEEVEDKDIDKRLFVKIQNIDNENMVQNETLDTTMLALDEMFILFEPILMTTMSVLSVNKREVRNPMVELYVVMIQRGLKTIDQVPARYREEVKAILDAIEK